MGMKPIFILGAPRSGTTFLASLLEKTAYGPPFETQFIIKYFKKLDNYGNLENFERFSRLINDILKERAVMQWKLDLDVKAFFTELGGEHTYVNIVDKLCLKASQKNGFLGWGDKTPDYIGDLSTLYRLFPDSKYLYIVRDGRDVALSLLEKDWGPNNIYYCAEYWAYLNREQSEMRILKEAGLLYELRYEDLLDNVEFYIRDIYQFLDMDFDEADVNRLRQTVKKGNYNKWKSRMSAFQVKVFETIAANSLSRFGYDTRHPQQGVSIFLKGFYFFHNLLFRIRHLFIINVIDGIKIRFFGKQPFAE